MYNVSYYTISIKTLSKDVYSKAQESAPPFWFSESYMYIEQNEKAQSSNDERPRQYISM